MLSSAELLSRVNTQLMILMLGPDRTDVDDGRPTPRIPGPKPIASQQRHRQLRVPKRFEELVQAHGDETLDLLYVIRNAAVRDQVLRDVCRGHQLSYDRISKLSLFQAPAKEYIARRAGEIGGQPYFWAAARRLDLVDQCSG